MGLDSPTNPPLPDRLLWREPLTPQTLISGDRGLMARTFGTLSLVGALLGTIVLIVQAHPRNHGVVAVTVAVEAAVAVACFVGYRRLPYWFFHFALLVASSMVALSAAVEPYGGQGVMALYTVWVVLLANLFFPTRQALAQSVYAVGMFSAVLFARGDPWAVNYAVATSAVVGTAGLVVGMLRSRLEQVASTLETEAKTDAVTGLLNRRGFNQRCDQEIARAAEGTSLLSLIACDLDRFKRVNDELGHTEGDIALRMAAEAILLSVRGVDEVGRMGGEEFAVLLPGADELEAIEIAERVRAAVREALAHNPVPVTISCGVSTLNGTRTREALLRAADEALYEAKRLGRDRTVAAAANGNGPEKRVVFAI